MLTKEEYQKQYQKSKDMLLKAKQDPFSLHYHLMPPTGWMNDPNGLCQKDGLYHIYYQYSPFDVHGVQKLWGHYTTKDFITYTNEEPFLYPDTIWDTNGVYSGTAFVENDTIHFFYTGNVKNLHWPDCDFIYSGRQQNTMMVTSKDGLYASEKRVLMTNDDYPQNMTKHVRDPKVFKVGDVYYMALGARTLEGIGCVLLYQSTDMKQWQYLNTLTTPQPLGYMWECPDLFELDGELFLVICPMQKKEPVYQAGYFKLNYDFEKNTYTLGDFTRLDEGFDYYAPQSFKDSQGRQIQIAWMGMPQADYDNEPTVAYSWQHALTIPRVLVNRNGIICQQPLTELKQLRKKQFTGISADFKSAADTCFEMIVEVKTDQQLQIQLREDAFLSYCEGILELDVSHCGQGRKTCQLSVKKLENLHIFSDTSSLEIFVNDGLHVLTTRIYSQRPLAKIIQGNVKIQYYSLGQFKIKER